jgi:hypothetical protein
VRQAVELLIQSSSTAIEETLSSGITKVQPTDVYIAATRTVMRLVVVLFAEARGLLPRENPSYHQSYGLQGLREELERSAGGRAERLRHRYSAWPRMLSLFRLIYEGSSHEDLPIQQYGGGLFVPGHDGSLDPVLRALAALESPSSKQPITDDVVYRIIQLLTRSRMKVRQGRGATWVESPVDFSDLSSEYIGILYEGLLDFELRQVPKDDAIVFVNIGDQPALPLSRLKDMNNDELKKLFEKLKAKPTAGDGEEDEEVAGDAEGGVDEDADDAGVVDVIEAVDAVSGDDTRRAVMTYALDWAERAVKAAEIVKPPRGRQQTDPVARTRYQEDVLHAARALIVRLVTPGEWFLVRWGGTRKGAGTFYTRPQLAGPTTRRTLQPLAYAAMREQKDEKTGLVDVLEWAPKKPEEILALKVCDPAMGSGSFLVSALRTLTEALFESLHKHGRITAQGDRSVVRLADGATSKETTDELLPVRPDHPEFEPRLRARLKRHVVERCLYGVDIDAVAVELARMALWVETMDPALPFEFLDHKLKVGNSLVGCWFDRFQDYPLAAWEREAGDEKHKGVHHEARAWADALKSFKTDVVKPKLADQLRARRGMVPLFGKEKKGAGTLHDHARKAFDEMHAIPVHDAVERARIYATKVRDDGSLRDLKRTFDAWCATWFWPLDDVDDAPTPDNLHDLPASSSALVAEVAQREKFFHWEIEYPDVFVAAGSGFDAIIGNPPWDIQKPSSKEFFSNHDPLYRTYGKQDALAEQLSLFKGSATIERDWIRYQGRFKGMSNWVGSSSSCWGDPAEASDGKGINLARGAENAGLHGAWRKARSGRTGYADPAHPFRHQGSADLNTYKMFLEQAHALLRADGQLGFIVPSGLYTDKGTTSLRELFLGACRWQWLFCFENREGIFDIHRSFKFAPVIVQKGGSTVAVRAAFMRRRLEDWEEAERYVLAYPRTQVEKFSPKSKAILEIPSATDLAILINMYAAGVLLGADTRWNFVYGTELHMTNDSKLFPPADKWRKSSFEPGSYGLWFKATWKSQREAANRGEQFSRVDGQGEASLEAVEEIAVPLYEGRMIGQNDYSKKGWVSGKGRTAVWREIGFEHKTVEPQYLLSKKDYLESEKVYRAPKIAYMRISSGTNARTMIATFLKSEPAGDSVFFYRNRDADAARCLMAAAYMNTLAYDYGARLRLGGLNMSEFVVSETSLPALGQSWDDAVLAHAAALQIPNESFSSTWLSIQKAVSGTWRGAWALTPHERLRRRVLLEAVAAHAYGLSESEFRWILRDCDHPIGSVPKEAPPKGFWRVDGDVPPERRLTVLASVAFSDLRRIGLSAFLDDTGWQLPAQLRLADYGLGLDERAKEHQPVASALGPRFYDWQLEQGVEESWEECARHAALLEQLLPTPKSEGTAVGKLVAGGGLTARAGDTNLVSEAVELDLFGNPNTTTGRKRGR